MRSTAPNVPEITARPSERAPRIEECDLGEPIGEELGSLFDALSDDEGEE